MDLFKHSDLKIHRGIPACRSWHGIPFSFHDGDLIGREPARSPSTDPYPSTILQAQISIYLLRKNFPATPSEKPDTSPFESALKKSIAYDTCRHPPFPQQTLVTTYSLSDIKEWHILCNCTDCYLLSFSCFTQYGAPY